MKNLKILNLIKVIVLLFIGIIIVAPLILLFVSSLKDDRYQIIAELGSIRAFFVSNPSINNFKEILGGRSDYFQFFVNSVVIMAGTVIGTMLISSSCAYALLRGRFRYKNVILTVIILLYIIPQEAIMLPMLYEAVKLNLLDTYTVQILPFVASPLYIFLFYQFFKEVPTSIAEAAKIDGVGFFNIYTRIFVPLSVPAFVTVAILQGMEAWNQYLWPLLVTQTEKVRPLTVSIAAFFGNSETYWDRLFAASVLMMIPLLVIYLIFQKYFIASVASSAVKE